MGCSSTWPSHFCLLQLVPLWPITHSLLRSQLWRDDLTYWVHLLVQLNFLFLKEFKRFKRVFPGLSELQDTDGNCSPPLLPCPSNGVLCSLHLPSIFYYSNLWWIHVLSGIDGSPLSDWAWLKLRPLFQWVSGGSCYAPAAFIGSLHHSSSLIAEILGWIPDTSTHLPSALSALAEAAGKPGWCSIQDIDVSLHLSRAIDEASYSALLSGASNPHFKALALSSAIEIG